MNRKLLSHWAWGILGICFLNFYVMYSIRLGYGILLPQMSKSLSLTKAQGGIIYSSFFLPYLVFSPVFGNLTDRIGARKVIGFFSMFLALGTTLMGRAFSVWTAALCFAIAGFGASALYSPVTSLVQRWFDKTRRGLALGILSMGPALGSGLAGIIIPILVYKFGWRSSWYLFGSFMFILVLINAIYLRSDPKELQLIPWGSEQGSVGRMEEGRTVHYREILALWLFWIIGISYFFIACVYYIIFTFLVMYLVTEIGVGYSIASGFITITAFAGLLGSFINLYVSDYIGRKKTILLCHLSIFLSTLGLTISKGNITGLIVSVSVLGFFFQPIFALYGACAKDYFKENMTGTIIGLWTLFYGIGGIFGPIIAGYIADKTETFIFSFYLAMMLVFISSFFLLLLKGKNERWARSQMRLR